MKHMSKKAIRKQASRQLLFIVIGFALGVAGLSGLVYGVMPGRTDLGSPEIGGYFTMIGGRPNSDECGSCRAPISGIFRLHALPGRLSDGALRYFGGVQGVGVGQKSCRAFRHRRPRTRHTGCFEDLSSFGSISETGLLKLHTVSVRLFAASGHKQHGMPIYHGGPNYRIIGPKRLREPEPLLVTSQQRYYQI
jgi:hypothetical protein